MKNDRLHLRLPAAVKVAAMKLAKKKGVTLSAMIERYLRQVVEDERLKQRSTVDAEQI